MARFVGHGRSGRGFGGSAPWPPRSGCHPRRAHVPLRQDLHLQGACCAGQAEKDGRGHAGKGEAFTCDREQSKSAHRHVERLSEHELRGVACASRCALRRGASSTIYNAHATAQPRIRRAPVEERGDSIPLMSSKASPSVAGKSARIWRQRSGCPRNACASGGTKTTLRPVMAPPARCRCALQPQRLQRVACQQRQQDG